MSLKRRTSRFHLAVCCLLWSSWSLLLADGGNGGLGPAASLSAYAPWQLLKVSTRFGGFSPYPTFIEGQSPRGTTESDDSHQCNQAGTCSRSSPQTTDTAATAGLQAPAAAAASTAAAAGSAAELQAQQAHQQVQGIQTAAEQQQLMEPPLQQPQDLQQQPILQQEQPVLQESSQATPQQPEQQPSTPAGEATLQEPAAAESAQQQMLTAPAAVQRAAAVDPNAAASVPASQPQQQQQQRTPPPSPVRRLLNLAELSDGASVLAANPEAKKPERAIDKDIDSFMKNDCNAHKWMIIELSQLGTVETVKLTMKELYSSRVHTFGVFGRSSHPRKDGPDLTASLASEAWQLLGSFTAENKRGTQAFLLPQRSRVRYLLLTFDTHYGSEAMCAMNWIEVLGVSAAQELEEALALQELEAEGEEHEQQQQLFVAQQLEQFRLQQQQQQQVTVVQPNLPQQQQQVVLEPVQQRQQQQTELPGEQQLQQQQAAVPAAANADGMPGIADTGFARTAAGGSSGGISGASTQQQSVAVDAAASGQAAESQQQQQEEWTSSAATQQPGQQPATVTRENGSSLQPQQDAPARSADEAGATGPAASSGQLAAQAAATAGQPSLAAASGDTTAAAELQQHVQGIGELSGVVGDKAGMGAEVDVQQQQQPTGSSPAVEHGAAVGADNGKQQQVARSSANAQDTDTQSGAPAVAESAQGSAVTPADVAADSSSSVPAADPTGEQQLPAPAAVAGVTGVAGGGQAIQAAASSTGTPAAAVELLSKSSTFAAASSDAAAAAGVPGGVATTDKPAVSAGGAEAASGAAGQPAAEVPSGSMQGASSHGEPAASASQPQQAQQAAQQQQQPATLLQQQQPVAQQQQQQQPAASQQRPQQKAQPREGASALESWSSTAKPKQAGNLFDIIKSEMMQMKLDQSKVSKKLDGLAKRSTDFEAVVALLQQQQAQVLAQIDNLTTRLEQVAEQQQQQAAAARQYMSHHHHMPGPAGAAAPAGAGLSHHPHLNHPHMQSGGSSMHGHGAGAGPGIPVCESHLHHGQLLLQPHFQWGIVTALSLTCVLGLCLLLHPRCALLPHWLRVAVCCLAVLNGMLAGLLSVWLLVVQSMLLGPAVVHLPAEPLVRLPTHRMLGSPAWDQP